MMKRVCIGLAIANLLIGIISGISMGFWGFVLGLLSGILSGGLYLMFAYIMQRIDDLQKDVRSVNERIYTLSKKSEESVKCSVCGNDMTPENDSCPRCGAQNFIKLS